MPPQTRQSRSVTQLPSRKQARKRKRAHDTAPRGRGHADADKGGGDHSDDDDADDINTASRKGARTDRVPKERPAKRRRPNQARESSASRPPQSPRQRRTHSPAPSVQSQRAAEPASAEASAAPTYAAGAPAHFTTEADYGRWEAEQEQVAERRGESVIRIIGSLEGEIARARQQKQRKAKGRTSGSASGETSEASDAQIPPTMPRSGRAIKTVLGTALTAEDEDDQLELDDNCLVYIACPPAEDVRIQTKLRALPGGKGRCFACTTGGPSVTAEKMATIARMWEDGAPFSDPVVLAKQIATYYELKVRIPANQVIKSKRVWNRGTRGNRVSGAATAPTALGSQPTGLERLVREARHRGSGGDDGAGEEEEEWDHAADAGDDDRNAGDYADDDDDDDDSEDLLPPWTAASIYEHFTEHVDDPELFVAHTIRELKIIKKHLYKRGIFNFNARRRSDVRIKEKNLRLYISVIRELVSFYKLDSRTLALHRPGRSATSLRNGPRVNLKRPLHSIPGGCGAGENLLMSYLTRTTATTATTTTVVETAAM